MATINVKDAERIEILVRRCCPQCHEEYRNLIVALVNVDSLKRGELESFGFSKFRVEGIRRRYRVGLPNCDAEVTFDWKDGKVSNLDIVCPKIELIEF